MDDEEDVLEIGVRRRRPVVVRLLAVLVLAGAVGAYFGLRGDDRPAPNAHTPPPSSYPAPSPGTTYPTDSPGPALPAWPQADGACGSTAFLPIVSATALHEHTGIHAVVGDRLRTVDVDSGAVTPVAGLPAGQFATQLATAGASTYALLTPCWNGSNPPSTVIRLDHASAHFIARGPYNELLGGGDHPWAVIWPGTENSPALLDPLDGGRRISLPLPFQPLAAYRNLVIGTVQSAVSSAENAPFTIEVMDPRTRRVVRSLGPATSVAVDQGLIVWLGAGCARCAVHTYDLADGSQTQTRGLISSDGNIWSGVISPDHRTMAFVRQRSVPSPYATEHPGNPNEIAILDLASGSVRAVPGLVMWSKAFPGMTFSDDSRWLAITLDEGRGVRLLVWRAGLTAPLQSPALLPGKVAYQPTLATAA